MAVHSSQGEWLWLNPFRSPFAGAPRAEPVEAPGTAEQNLIEHAAALQPDDRFRADKCARRCASGHRDQRLDLSVRDSQAFVEALLNPLPVNDRLPGYRASLSQRDRRLIEWRPDRAKAPGSSRWVSTI